MSTTICFVSRAEALGFPDGVTALGALSCETLDAMARASGRELVEEDGYALWRWEVLEDLCVLDAGHRGPHAFEDQRHIILEFAPAEPAVAEGGDGA